MDRRVLGVGIAVVVLAGAAWFFVAGGRQVVPLGEVAAPVATPAAELSPESDAADETSALVAPTAVTSAAAAAFAPRTPAGAGPGNGRVFGTVEATGQDALPPGTVVSLHRIDMEAKIVEYDDTLIAAAEPDADKKFEFTSLPLGRYSIYATAPGFTIQSSGELTLDRREREHTLRMVPGGTITGRVVNESRQPVEGAHVFTAAWDIGGQKRFGTRDRVLSSQVVTAADGSFTMEHLRLSLNGELGYRLAVKADGYATFLSDYIQAGVQGVEFMLKAGGVVVGQLVHYQSGDPIPDKTVSVESELAIERILGHSDAEGWFFLNNVPAGTHRLELIDGEMVVVPATAQFRVADAGSTDDLTVQVGPGGKLSGRVFDEDTGQGIAGARISISRADQGASMKPVTTGGDGVYTLKGLKDGSYALRLEKVEGYPYSWREEDSTKMSSASIGSETHGIDFGLSRGLTISGVVVDESGKPVEQASVNAQSDQYNTSDYSRSDARGAFVVAGFKTGDTVYVDAGKAGYALVGAEPEKGMVKIEEVHVTGVRLVMSGAASISGKLVDKLNRPKAGVQMHARSETQINRGSPIESTAADGSITFDNLAPGEYKLICSDLPWEFAQNNATVVKVAKGERVTGVKILYPELEGLTITGRVTDAQGRPVVRATVRVFGPTHLDCETNPDGTYTAGGLVEGEHALFAASGAHSTSEVTHAQAGATNVNFVLQGLSAIEGRVVSRATGDPVSEFRVRIVSDQQNRFYVRNDWVMVRDVEGRFRLSEVEAGQVSVEVRPVGFAEAIHSVGVVKGGETISDVIIRVENGATLTGRVLDGGGQAVSAAQLFVATMPQDEWSREREKRATSGADGSYELASLAPGTVTVHVHHARFAPTSRDIRVSAGAVNRADIVLDSGATVTGIVTLNGRPISAQTVHYSTGRQHERVQTDAQGRYTIGGLPDGNVHLNPFVQTPEGVSRGKSVNVTVANGTITEMDFNFVTGTSTIEGTVFTAPGEPARGGVYVRANIANADGSSDYFNSQVDNSGRYTMEFVPAGTVSLTASTQNGKQQAVSLTVGDRQRIQQDFHLYGFGTLNVAVSGIPQGYVGAVWLVPGIFGAGMLTASDIDTIDSGRIGQYGGINNGVARHENVAPGTYTLVAVVGDQRDYPGTRRWTSNVVEIARDQELSVTMSL